MNLLKTIKQFLNPPTMVLPAICVLMQSFLLIVQHILLYVLMMSEETASTIRVLASAAVMLLAILICFRKKSGLFVKTYFLAVLVLLMTILIFPQNTEIMIELSAKFLIPMVISSALCVIAIGNIHIVERVLDVISWTGFLTSLLLIYAVVKGLFFMEHYSLSLSYALLVVMIGLYSQKTIYAKVAAIFTALIVVAIGSRGALVFFGTYILYDMFRNHKKLILPAVITFIFILGLLTQFADFLNDYGIDSRTLRNIADGSFGESDGRDTVYTMSLKVFWDNCILGVGLFGDRVAIGGYCHNLFLEILMDFGLIFGGAICLLIIFKYLRLFFKATDDIRDILVKYSLAFLAPLMLSGSYLQDYNFGIFVGVFVLLSHELKNRKKYGINYQCR